MSAKAIYLCRGRSEMPPSTARPTLIAAKQLLKKMASTGIAVSKPLAKR